MIDIEKIKKHKLTQIEWCESRLQWARKHDPIKREIEMLEWLIKSFKIELKQIKGGER